jgi:hypothetical protein
MACSQANLTSTWVSTETEAGWHLIPTYVGLQAPSNSCGCQAIVASKAQAEGTAAANDAVAHAESLGIGPGNPIYFDMEAYPRGGSNTTAVLTFLSAWTTQLHADSYLSGVYSSGASGIGDLAAQMGTGYLEPDDIWIADWNGRRPTSAFTSTRVATTRPTAGSRSTSTATTSTEPLRAAPGRSAAAQPTPPRLRSAASRLSAIRLPPAREPGRAPPRSPTPTTGSDAPRAAATSPARPLSRTDW